MRIRPFSPTIFSFRQEIRCRFPDMGVKGFAGCVLSFALVVAQTPVHADDVLMPSLQIEFAQIIRERLDFANGLFQRGFYEMALTEYESIIADYSVEINLPQETPAKEVLPQPQEDVKIPSEEIPAAKTAESAPAEPAVEDTLNAPADLQTPATAVVVETVESPPQTVQAEPAVVIDEKAIQHRRTVSFAGLAMAGKRSLETRIALSAAAAAEALNLEEACIGRAESLFFLKRHKDALLQYRKILADYPQTVQRPIAMVRAGQCLYHLKKYRLAGDVFERLNAAALSEDLKSTYLFYSAAAWKALERYEKAREALEQLIALGSSGEQTWLSLVELAEIETALKNESAAAARFDQAFEKAESEQWKSQVLYRKGKAQFGFERYADALGTFQKLLEQFPGQAVAFRVRASLMLTLYQLDKYDEIIIVYKTHPDIWDFSREDYQILKIIIKSFESSGQLQEGLILTEKILSREDLTLERRKELSAVQADLLIKTKQFSKLKDLTGTVAVDVWPDDYRLFLKAEADYGAGDYPAALQAYEKLKTEFPASKWFASAIYGLAFTHRDMGQIPEAVRWFDELHNTAEDAETKRGALYHVVLTYNQVSSWVEGIRASEKFLSLYPDAPEAERVRYLRGYFYFKQADYGQAVDVLKAFLDFHPDSALKKHALFYLGYSFQSLDQSAEAFKYYDMISIGPAADAELDAAVIKNRALLYLKEKQDDKAAAEFRKMTDLVQASNLDPDLILWLIEYDIARGDYEAALRILEMVKGRWTGGELVRVNYLTGDIYRRSDRCAQALSAFEAATAVADNETSFKGLAYLGRVDCLEQMQRYDEAADLLKLVSDQYHNDAFITLRTKFATARLQESQGNFEQAVKFYMLTAVLYSDEDIVPEALYRAGQIFEKLNKKTEAVKAYAEILQDHSSSHYVSKAEERIKVLQ